MFVFCPLAQTTTQTTSPHNSGLKLTKPRFARLLQLKPDTLARDPRRISATLSAVSPRDLGPDYPAFLLDRDGTPIPLYRERRWSRQYRHPTGKHRHHISRFYDGSASISFVELSDEWSRWTVVDRHEFSSNCRWLHSQADFIDMLRFILREGDPNDWSNVALSVARTFSSEEGFVLLVSALDATPIEHSANLLQAISMTRHLSASTRISEHFEKLWLDPRLWDDDPFTNWFAFTATCCIQYLLRLGEPPSRFVDAVRALASHPCGGNRDTCSRYLGATYRWLQSPEPPSE